MRSPTLSQLAERRVGIFGAGAEGRSTWEALARWGAPPPLVLVDQEPAPGTVPDGLRLVTGEGMSDALREVDALVRSPGVRLSHPLLAEAAARGIAVTTATRLFLHEVRQAGLPVVGITGSKGKSTTATLTFRVLAEAGRKAVLAGNIGKPCLDLLEEVLASGAITVLELSSYQCSDLVLGTSVAVFLSLFPEHMDWHGGVEAYFAAKLRLAQTQLPADLTLYSAADPELTARLPLGPARHQAFQDERDLHYADGWFWDGKERLFADGAVRLRGRHNRVNAVAALAATRPLGAAPKHLERVLAKFSGLPHRLEPVGMHAGIRWVNDSISTAPEAAVAAIEAFSGEVDTLIAGGSDRGFDFGVLARALARSSVRTVITLPPGGAALAAAIRAGCPPGKPEIASAGDLAAAVERAAAVTARGRICLLSPGSPSYGAFRNFEDRGEQFRA
ncbi:MAG TPA: UDP-N-acetylmuramoyl-L-alanine--D-glutamate ligase, partial [Thermoanaerobaculia bacterium]|nr:UDP-N-acetylmuramoyl-L-alanine--D-glutamate ligase [Thermoanaerobaculia bacterium]